MSNHYTEIIGIGAGNFCSEVESMEFLSNIIQLEVVIRADIGTVSWSMQKVLNFV